MKAFPTLPFRIRHGTVIFVHDLLMVALAWLGAYLLRFNLTMPPEWDTRIALQCLPVVLIVQAAIFRQLGLYRGVWRFASVPDLIRIGKAACFGIVLIAIILFFINRLQGIPRTVIPLYPVLLMLLLAGPRLLYRMWKDQGAGLTGGQRALVVGAGKAGEMLVRDLLRSGDARFAPIAFVDDDPHKKGAEIHGLRVRGRCENIPRLVERLEIDVILLALPSATDREMRRVVEICENLAVPFLTLPSVQDMLSDRAAGDLREVSIEDLLGRTPVRLDRDRVREHLGGNRVMVTGGGGSIGSELCKQIARHASVELIIFERSEFNLYKVERELRRDFPGLTLTALLGDVTDRVAVEHAIALHQPKVIFHAAAYKHVPLLQSQPREAIWNNIVGTQTVADAAMSMGVKEFVLISTDKAVRPTNIMGATKRAAEMLVQSLDAVAATRFITVRFGNVLDSAGSVVPLFREQIRTGGPVTVTDPDVTRYFMTIPEACQLIMQAAAVGQGGEVFVLDMGEPIKIRYLAEQMIRLSGKRPGEDIRIEYVGLRPGEKITEELFLDQEQPQPTEHRKLMLAQSVPLDHRMIRKNIADLAEACKAFDQMALPRKLKALVPEYSGEAPEDQGTTTRTVVL